jgi:3-oxoacyl-[acyl-carrier protein] reductase
VAPGDDAGRDGRGLHLDLLRERQRRARLRDRVGAGRALQPGDVLGRAAGPALTAALVTGVGNPRGIAVAVVRALERDGWSVATTGYEPELDVTIDANLADADAATRILDAAEAAAGRPTALVNAHTHFEPGSLVEATATQIDRHLAVNVRGTLLLTAEFVRRLDRPGRIVNFTTGLPLTGQIAYAASKGAIEGITVSAAAELAARRITVNAIDPGPTDTGWMSDELAAQLGDEAPAGRVGRPEDAADLVAFLVSPRAGWITGQVIHSDGGFRLRPVR